MFKILKIKTLPKVRAVQRQLKKNKEEKDNQTMVPLTALPSASAHPRTNGIIKGSNNTISGLTRSNTASSQSKQGKERHNSSSLVQKLHSLLQLIY